jgi:hypothetical protein
VRFVASTRLCSARAAAAASSARIPIKVLCCNKLAITNLYHETITWGYVFLIHERMERDGREKSWKEFVDTNPDLFDWRNSVLKVYYRDETLSSELARNTFLWPDNLQMLNQREA